MNPRHTIWRAAALALAWTLPLLSASAGPGKDAKAAEPETIPVRVMRIELRDLEQALEYVGDIKGQDEATVYPKVTGKIAEKVKEDSMEVQKGDILAYVDRDEVGYTFEKAPVESPLAGIVGRVYVDRGTTVGPQTPIALIVNIDQVKIDLDIPEKYLPRMAIAQTAQIIVDAYPQAFTGRVTKVSPVVDLATRTAPVEILIPNPEHNLKPGMFARVRLVLEQRQGVPVVMKEAVLGVTPDQYVYVARDGVARKQAVALGLRRGGEYEVVEGLREGEQVVIMGQQRLQDGIAVAVEEQDRP